MRSFAIAGVAVLAIAGSTAVYAQHHHWSHGHMRMNFEDRAALVDARIAAVHAGLKLTPDQEKLWPAVETAVRDFAKLRIDRANARTEVQKNASPDDPVSKLRERAGNMATSADALKKIADAADPLYKTLDEGQKRRLAVLTHMEQRFGAEGWRRHRLEQWMDHGDERGGHRYERNRHDDGDGGLDRDGSGRL